jgi:hypothetical protein
VRDKTSFAVPEHARLVVGSAEAACDAACAGIGTSSAFAHNIQLALERGALASWKLEFLCRLYLRVIDFDPQHREAFF